MIRPRVERLYCEISGSGQPVLLLHSGLGDSRMWREVAAKLERRYRVYSPDLRGYGRSPLGKGRVSHVRDVERLLKAVHLGRTFLVGVSLGARVAAEFAALHPERVAGLVLASPVFPTIRWSARTRRWREREDQAARRGDVPSAINCVLRLWADGVGRRGASKRVRQRLRVMQFEAYRLPDVRETPQPPEAVIGRLRRSGVPTLVIVGRHDVPEVRDAARRFARTIRADMTSMDAAHLPPLERPATLARHVNVFITQVTARNAHHRLN